MQMGGQCDDVRYALTSPLLTEAHKSSFLVDRNNTAAKTFLFNSDMYLRQRHV